MTDVTMAADETAEGVSEKKRVARIRWDQDADNLASFKVWSVGPDLKQVGDIYSLDLDEVLASYSKDVVYQALANGFMTGVRTISQNDPLLRSQEIGALFALWKSGTWAEKATRNTEAKLLLEAVMALREEQGKDVSDAIRETFQEKLKSPDVRAALLLRADVKEKLNELRGVNPEAGAAAVSEMLD